MGKIPQELRETIARNIRDCRQKMFPGRGGSKKCAEAISLFLNRKISPQQWSPWERGMRTPDEVRLEQIARFFDVTVEFLRKDHRPPRPPGAPPLSGLSETRDSPGMDDIFNQPSLRPDRPGSPESFYWLAKRFVDSAMSEGVRIRLDRSTAEFIVSILSRNIGDS